MNRNVLMWPVRAIGISAIVLAVAVTFWGCSNDPGGVSNPMAVTSEGPYFVPPADELEVTVTSDADTYDVGETAHFTIAIYKDGALWEGNYTIVDATFPDASTPVTLTPLSLGSYSYETPLSSTGEKTLSVSVRGDFARPIATMEDQIARLEGEVADLEDKLAGETDPRMYELLQTQINKRLAMIARFEGMIADMQEPLAVGAKTITVESLALISLRWLNMMNGVMAEQTHVLSRPLSEAMMAVAPMLGIPPWQLQFYDACTTPYDPLDETKTLEELGINDGMLVYVWLP